MVGADTNVGSLSYTIYYQYDRDGRYDHNLFPSIHCYNRDTGAISPSTFSSICCGSESYVPTSSICGWGVSHACGRHAVAGRGLRLSLFCLTRRFVTHTSPQLVSPSAGDSMFTIRDMEL